MSGYASAGNKRSGVAIMLSSFRGALPDNSIVSAVSILSQVINCVKDYAKRVSLFISERITLTTFSRVSS